MKINEIITDWMIMPQSIKALGLIHKPGTGPNNRFDFKNKGNNRANEKAPPGREHQVKKLKDKFYKALEKKLPKLLKKNTKKSELIIY